MSNRLVAAVFVVLLVVLLFWMPDPIRYLSDSDGGNQIAGAQQIAAGEHPFVDWRTTYGPLRFYLSFLFRLLFDGRVGAEYVLCALGMAATYTLMASCTYRVSRRVWIALGVTAVAFVLMPRYVKFYIALAPILALHQALAYLERPTRARVAAMAAAIVFAAAYRLDVGAWALAPCAIAVLVSDARVPKRRRLAEMGGWALAFASPWLAFLLWNGALATYLVDSTYWGIGLARGLAKPVLLLDRAQGWTAEQNLTAASFLASYAIAAAAAVYLALRFRSLPALQKKQLLVAAPLAAAALLQTLHRSDFSHLLQGLTGVYVLLAFVIADVAETFADRSSRGDVIRRAGGPALLAAAAVTAALTIATGLVAGPVAPPSLERWTDWQTMYSKRMPEFLAAAAARFPDAPEVQLPLRLREIVRPGERFFAMPYLTHLYAATERRFAGGQFYLAPGYFNDEQGQSSMIERLRQQGLPVIVEAPDAAYDDRAERSSRAIAPALCRFIEAHYARDSAAGLPAPFVLWRPKQTVSQR